MSKFKVLKNVTGNNSSEGLRSRRLVLAGAMPSFNAGANDTYSLLFEMHRVFEAFVARYLARNAAQLGLTTARVRAQMSSHDLVRREMARDAAGVRRDFPAALGMPVRIDPYTSLSEEPAHPPLD